MDSHCPDNPHFLLGHSFKHPTFPPQSQASGRETPTFLNQRPLLANPYAGSGFAPSPKHFSHKQWHAFKMVSRHRTRCKLTPSPTMTTKPVCILLQVCDENMEKYSRKTKTPVPVHRGTNQSNRQVQQFGCQREHLWLDYNILCQLSSADPVG